MINPASPFPPPSELRATLFPPTSRYHGLEFRTLTLPGGEVVSYLSRRFVPSPEKFVTIREHAVTVGERLDNVAARYLGDPEQFWRIADANHELNPVQLTASALQRIRITLPEGIPGMPNE